MDKCKDCKYFDDDGRGKEGRCRRKSPFLVWGNSSITQSQQEADGRVNDFDSYAIWPITNHSDWCGEFEAEEKIEIGNMTAQQAGSLQMQSLYNQGKFAELEKLIHSWVK